MPGVIVLSIIMLCAVWMSAVLLKSHGAECLYSECHCTDSHGASLTPYGADFRSGTYLIVTGKPY